MVSIRHSFTVMWPRRYSSMQARIQLRAVLMDQWGHSIGRMARRRRNSISINKVAEGATHIRTARNDRTRALARLRISTGRTPTIYPPAKCFPGRRKKIRSCTIGTRCAPTKGTTSVILTFCDRSSWYSDGGYFAGSNSASKLPTI